MASSALPPLVETFPADKYPLREVGQGFTAQACRGPEAESCARVAEDMLLESRTFEVSAAASVGSETSLDGTAADGEVFAVADLPLPEGTDEVRGPWWLSCGFRPCPSFVFPLVYTFVTRACFEI